MSSSGLADGCSNQTYRSAALRFCCVERRPDGSLHPLTLVEDEIVGLFLRLGYRGC